MNNNYISLYRKYRPKDFNSVAGHKNLKEILVSEIVSHSLPSSLLFVGQKGTGKTSLAKILAKIINCENINSSTGEACENCESCKMANNNSHPDIYEIDAASNNGVDEIRNINSSVFTLPILGKKKIFIIDEVHMLTSNAFNAFLKTLEEPPLHVTFILATTEFQKIPATILSRCQVFNFKKISLVDVKERMKNILELESCTADENALNEIYYLSDGSLRDALNYLEQLMMVSKPNLSVEKLTSLFSVATKEEKIKIFKNIFLGNSKYLISFFEKSMQKGLDVEILILQLIDIVKELIEFRITNDESNLNYLLRNDLKEFEGVETKNFFELADVLAGVYEKTNKTNISYQYLVVSILKWVHSFSTPLISVVEKSEEIVLPISETENEDTMISFDSVIKENQNKVEGVVESENIFEEQIEPVIEIEQEVVADEGQIIEEPLIENKVEIENIETPKILKVSEEIMFKQNDIENMMMRIISEVNYIELPDIKFEHTKIINVLLNAKSEERKNWTNAFENMFIESEKVNEYHTVFFNSKVVAACPDAIIIYIASPIYVKIANNLLQNIEYRNSLFQKLGLNEINILVIDKSTWSEIKDEYGSMKQNNTLPQYDEKLFDQFYKNVIRHTAVMTKEEDEILLRAKDFFDSILIKVVD